jgi:hypothetical protein
MHSDRNAKIQSGSLIGSLAIEAIIGSMNSGRSFHCGGSDKSTGQQSERLGDFHMGLISARQFSVFVKIDKEFAEARRTCGCEKVRISTAQFSSVRT